jgi:hypothetical protein
MRCSFALLAVTALLVAASACQDRAAQGAPDLSAPPSVRSTMWSLAVHTNLVAALLAQETRSPEELLRIKQAVDDVAKLAAGLAVDAEAKRHPLVKKGLADFQARAPAAQAGLAKDPPDLRSVDAMVSSCRECHARGLPPKPEFTL